MPNLEWLKSEFGYGYSSGNVLSRLPDLTRRKEERAIGGSYRALFRRAIVPYTGPGSSVLELGPGRGSWSRAILQRLTEGQLHTVDFQDVTPWLHPERYPNRLICHKVEDNTFACVADGSFDLFWAFGVLCHNNVDNISIILRNVLKKMKPGAIGVAHYAEWGKLDRYGWERGRVPTQFRGKPDDEIWWPRNSVATMTTLAKNSGWRVLDPDLDVVQRDAVMLMMRPG
jgi:SAM-dependent methyltransferase